MTKKAPRTATRGGAEQNRTTTAEGGPNGSPASILDSVAVDFDFAEPSTDSEPRAMTDGSGSPVPAAELSRLFRDGTGASHASDDGAPLPEEPPDFLPPVSPVRPYTPAPAALGRTLPHSIEAEEYLLGSVFADSSGGSDVLARCESAGVSAESFYDARHGILFGCMADLHRRGLAVEPATIAEELKRTRQLDAVGGYSFLVQVSGRIPTTAQAAYFIDKVREQQILRDLIRAGTGIVENCYTHSGGEIETLIESTERQMHRICQGHAFGEVWEYRSIADFSMPPADDPDALLGKYRFLCRGGGLVIVGPTSIGESSLEIQSSVCWALGRDFLGIPCTRPLKSLLIGSEDDFGDLAEMWVSVAAGMRLTKAEISIVKKRVLFAEERVEIGDAFLRKLKRAIASTKKSDDPFDLVRLNPLLAFAGCSVADQEEMGRFLRAGLNRVNCDKRFAYVISHHTNKPPAKDGKSTHERNWNEWAYAMSGSAEIANWSRAVIAIEPLKDEGRFILRLAKRGRRAGVTRETKPAVEGYSPAVVEVVTSIYARHAAERVQLDPNRSIPMILWLPDSPPVADAEQSGASKRPGPAPRFTFEDIRPAFVGRCPTPEKPAPFMQLHRAAEVIDSTITKQIFAKLLRAAVEDGKIIKCPDGRGYHLP